MVGLKGLTEEDVLAVSRAAGEPDWLRDRRQEAFKAFSDFQWPDNRVEEWRHTNPKRFDLGRPLVTRAGESPRREAGIVAAAGDEVAARIRIVDGGLAETWVSEAAAAQGVVVTGLDTAVREHSDLVKRGLGAGIGAEDVFTALNLAAFTAGVLIHVPADVEVAGVIAVSIDVASPGAYLPRTLVSLGRHARATVYVDHAGDAAATVVEVVEVLLDEGAAGRVVSAQDWGPQVGHIGAHRGIVGRNAEFRSLEATLGGDTVYIRPDVALDGPGARGELFGVYFGSGEQHMEHRSLIHHNASHTTSESVYKGALQDRSRAAWYGNIRIEQHAKATTSDETNRNLILSDGAGADSIPFLEILTSDVVGCGHHSSVGQVDEVQLFYLESRGIPREEAARLLVFGFFTEVLERMDIPAVTETVLAEIEAELRVAPTSVMDQRRR